MTTTLTGSEAQVEWAARIRTQASQEFDRVAAALRVVAASQGEAERAQTEAIVAILEEKRAEVLSVESAGYFIKEWQESSDQVRRLIAQDPRHQAIRARREVSHVAGK